MVRGGYKLSVANVDKGSGHDMQHSGFEATSGRVADLGNGPQGRRNESFGP